LTRVFKAPRDRVYAASTDPEQMKQWSGFVTVEFRHHPQSTELRLTHERLPSKESRDNHARGWNSALDKLEHFLARRNFSL